jgi:AraC-like DNA-binding protein/mannose-6-phosphate isomerase-like protein (cupin superfamily)
MADELKRQNAPSDITVWIDEGGSSCPSQGRHDHNAFEICYLMFGKAVVHIGEGRTFLLSTGDVALIPPHTAHCVEFPSGEDHRSAEISFHSEFVNELIMGQDNGNLLSLFYPNGNKLAFSAGDHYEVEHMAREMRNELDRRDANFSLAVKLDLMRLLIFFARRARVADQIPAGAIRDRYVNEIVDYASHNFREDLSLEETAHKFFLDKSVLAREFKRATGRTFTEYVNGRRVLEAKRILRQYPDMRIQDVCEAIGFHNVTYFDRLFRRTERLTPRQFQQHYRARREEAGAARTAAQDPTGGEPDTL